LSLIKKITSQAQVCPFQALYVQDVLYTQESAGDSKSPSVKGHNINYRSPNNYLPKLK